MKFVFYLLSILLLFYVKIFSQWKPINPRPFLDDCFVISGSINNCTVISRGGNIVFTTDNGNTWEYSYTKKHLYISRTQFLNERYGWASTTGSGISRTTDGGNTWESIGDSLEFVNWDFFFKDTLNGWTVGNHYVKSTTDGGKIWNTYILPSNSLLFFISEYDDSTLFTGGFFLYRTTNKGISWDRISGPLDFYSYRDFLSVKTESQNLGFVLAHSSGLTQSISIAKTTDGGDSWELSLPNYSNSQINFMEYGNGVIIACGSDILFKSTDLGNTWDSVAVPKAEYKTAYFTNDSIIYVSGEKGALIKSTDRGNSFSAIHTDFIGSNNGSFSSVSLFDSLNGYFAFHWMSDKIYRTSDGGDTFIDITPSGIVDNVPKIYAVTKDMAVASSSNKIFTTKDGGNSWNVSMFGQPNTYVAFDFYFKNTLNGMAGCTWNLMRETTDGGDTWTNRFLGTTQEHILSISFPDEEFGFYCTGDKLYKTTNGGVNWEFFKFLDPGFTKIKFIDRLNGVAGGNILSVTTDGGMNWNICNWSNYYCDFDIMKNGNGSVLMAIIFDSLYISFDLGATVKGEIIPFEDFTEIAMINPATAWLTGFYGKIVQYHDKSIPVNIQTDNPDSPISNFELYQNYPNPFNPTTKIKFTIPQADNPLLGGTRGGFVSLKVYDILGIEIATLVNEEKPAGNYEVEFDATGLSSGTYFYKIIAGDFVSVKKMLLMK